MENMWIFPLIIIILGYAYLGVSFFLFTKKTVPIGIPTIPVFWMIKKEKNPRYFLVKSLINFFMSFVFIFAGFYLLIKILY